PAATSDRHRERFAPVQTAVVGAQHHAAARRRRRRLLTADLLAPVGEADRPASGGVDEADLAEPAERDRQLRPGRAAVARAREAEARAGPATDEADGRAHALERGEADDARVRSRRRR